MKNPKVSVILAVYNGALFLSEAVESIVKQSFKDFEFIIINDGSTDNTEEILNSFTDSRIIRLKNEKNIGLVKSLNRSLEIARGEFIARMDADDTSLPERFEKQIKFLETHPDIGVLGTAMRHIDANGKVISTLTPPAEDGIIRWKMFFEWPIFHPTVMMRRDLVLEVGGYDSRFLHCEDGDLWRKLLTKTKFTNLQEVLYVRRLHKKSVSNLYAETQRKFNFLVKEKMLKEVLGKDMFEYVGRWVLDNETFLKREELAVVAKSLTSLFNVFVKQHQISEESLAAIKNDLAGRISSVNNSGSRKVLKKALNYLRTKLPMDIKHKLRHSTTGEFLYRKIRGEK